MSELSMVRETERFRPRRASSPTPDGEGEDSPIDPEVLSEDYDTTDDYGDNDDDWTPDRDKARSAAAGGFRAEGRAEASMPPSGGGARPRAVPDHGPVDLEGSEILDDADDFFRSESQPRGKAAAPPASPLKDPASSGGGFKSKRKSPYTQEEEDLIAAMGGKTMESVEGAGSSGSSKASSRREDGFLGDCTLREISSDFQMPVCYLADVLCGWGVPVPIDIDSRLGDMVTGEMAFSLVEAVHTLDVGDVNDRYSNFDLMGLCFEYDMDIKAALDFCVREGWKLPFGVRTYLRSEQEDLLVQNLSEDVIY